MAQLSVDAGVTLRSPVTAAGGDSTRALGWGGRDTDDLLQRGSVPTAVDWLYGGYSEQISGSRVIGSGLSFPRFADNVQLSPLVYQGYAPVKLLNPTRTIGKADRLATQRTTTGIVFRDPVDEQIVQPPPLQVNLGHFNNRIQRFQRNGAQAVFYKDQGQVNTRLQTARWGAQSLRDNGRGDSTWTRTAASGADLADLVLAGQDDSTWLRTGVAGVVLDVIHDEGVLKGARVRTGRMGVQLQQITDVGGYGGRNGTDSAGDTWVNDPWEWAFRTKEPYAWPGGYIDFETLKAWRPTDTGEWGYLIHPTGARVYQPELDDAEYARFYGSSPQPTDDAPGYTDGYPTEVRNTLYSVLWCGYNEWTDWDGHDAEGNALGEPIPEEGFYWGYRLQHHDQTYRSRTYDPPDPVYVPAGDLYLFAYGFPDWDIAPFYYDPADPAAVQMDDWDPMPIGFPPLPEPLTPKTGIEGGTPPPPARYGGEKRQPPANDRLRDFVRLEGLSGSIQFTDIAATLEATEPPLSIGSRPYRGSVWYQWEPNYDGQVTLTAADSGLELYTGPAPTPKPVVGVNGYKGDWQAGVDYAQGDRVAYNGKVYVASAPVPASSGKNPETPTVPGADAKVSVALNGSGVFIDAPIGARITLQPGTYYFMTDQSVNIPYNPGGGYVGPTSGVSTGTSFYGAAGGTPSSTGYTTSILLKDSQTGQVVAGWGPSPSSSASGFGSFRSQFTISAPVTFDTIRLYSTGYQSGQPVGTFGVATAGTRVADATWASAPGDLNPWTEEPDNNPLRFANLMPMGGGVSTVTTETRPGDRFYIRVYPLTESASGKTLTWESHIAYLDVTIPVPDLSTAPAMLNVTVGNATPLSLIEFRIGADPEVVGTAVADNDGFAATTLAIPALPEGAHLVIANEPTSTRIGNAAFTVGEAFEGTPDPDDPPAPPVVVPPPLPVPRWYIQDPTDQTNFIFVLNPSRVGSTFIPRVLTPGHSTAATKGQPIVFEGGKRAKRWVIEGHVLTLADAEALKAVQKNYRQYLVDDLGRKFIVKVVGVETTPVRDTEAPEHHSYVLTCLLYGKVPS